MRNSQKLKIYMIVLYAVGNCLIGLYGLHFFSKNGFKRYNFELIARIIGDRRVVINVRKRLPRINV